MIDLCHFVSFVRRTSCSRRKRWRRRRSRSRRNWRSLSQAESRVCQVSHWPHSMASIDMFNARACVRVCVCMGRGKGARRVRVGRLDRRPHSNAHQMITQLSGCCILLAISWRKSQPPHPLPAYTHAIYDSPQRAHTHTETHTGNVLPTNRRYVSYPATRCWPSCVFRFTIE